MPLVLLPGTLCDERVFAPLLHHLPGLRTQVIGCTEASSMQQAAQQVLSEAPEKFALLGFSLGGMVALEIVAHAPERVCGLALVSTSPLPAPVERHAARRASVELAGTIGLDAFAQTHLWPDYRAAGLRGVDDRTYLPLIRTMAVALGHGVLRGQTEMALGRPDYRPLLKTVHCPALVVAGDEDQLCPREAQQTLHRGLKNSSLHLIKGAGHLALLEQADEIALAVAAWFHIVVQQQGTTPAETAAWQETK